MRGFVVRTDSASGDELPGVSSHCGPPETLWDEGEGPVYPRVAGELG